MGHDFSYKFLLFWENVKPQQFLLGFSFLFSLLPLQELFLEEFILEFTIPAVRGRH